MVLAIAVLGVGYVLGVWTACMVFWQPQREYEEAARTTAAPVKVPVTFQRDISRQPRSRQ